MLGLLHPERNTFWASSRAERTFGMLALVTSRLLRKSACKCQHISAGVFSHSGCSFPRDLWHTAIRRRLSSVFFDLPRFVFHLARVDSGTARTLAEGLPSPPARRSSSIRGGDWEFLSHELGGQLLARGMDCGTSLSDPDTFILCFTPCPCLRPIAQNYLCARAHLRCDHAPGYGGRSATAGRRRESIERPRLRAGDGQKYWHQRRSGFRTRVGEPDCYLRIVGPSGKKSIAEPTRLEFVQHRRTPLAWKFFESCALGDLSCRQSFPGCVVGKFAGAVTPPRD